MPTVLVVDDEPAVRQALRRALALDGYEVDLAADSAQGLRHLALAAPDVIILDVLMPEVDGLEFCRRLRAADDRTPVLMLTVRDRVADRVAGLDAGADDYLTKPFALDELRAGCARCCDVPGTAGTGSCASATSRSIPARARCGAASAPCT